MFKQKLRSYILENFLFSDNDADLGDDDSFIEKGVIDSTGILEVITFLEEEEGVQVSEDDMTPENFDSVNKIVTYLERIKS